MQVDILEANNRLSELVKAAAAGEEVIIASNGKPVAKLVAVEEHRGLRGWGSLKIDETKLDAAFSAEVDEEVARLFESQ
ncbi:MAG TPA: type II toxin-antitoxin system prevent-host-death family antitoxin [Gammaproteobacteria bacterium]